MTYPSLLDSGKAIRILVAGTRFTIPMHVFDRHVRRVLSIYAACPEIIFISGAARTGADRLIIDWCRTNHFVCEEFPANWDRYGRSAGYIRNAEMAKVSDILLAFWDMESRGTKNMIELMEKKGARVIIIDIRKEIKRWQETEKQQRNRSSLT